MWSVTPAEYSERLAAPLGGSPWAACRRCPRPRRNRRHAQPRSGPITSSTTGCILLTVHIAAVRWRTGYGWVPLRECLSRGHVGRCDSSKNRHPTKHYHGGWSLSATDGEERSEDGPFGGYIRLRGGICCSLHAPGRGACSALPGRRRRKRAWAESTTTGRICRSWPGGWKRWSGRTGSCAKRSVAVLPTASQGRGSNNHGQLKLKR